MSINRPLLRNNISKKLTAPKTSSPLKKKLNLLSKLKNIVNIKQNNTLTQNNILSEFENEDMSNFLAEISNTLLTQMRNEEDCHVIISAAVFFIQLYPTFKTIYMQNLKNLIQNTIKNGSMYFLLIVYFENTYLIDEENVEKAFKILKLMNSEIESAKFCMYVSNVYKEMRKEYEESEKRNSKSKEIQKEESNYDKTNSDNSGDKNRSNTNTKNDITVNDHTIDKNTTENSLTENTRSLYFCENIKKCVLEFVNEKKDIFDKNLVDIKKIYENLDEKYKKETKSFVKVIEPEENEFDFYNNVNLFEHNEFIKEHERFIKQINTYDIEKLVEISIKKIKKSKEIKNICKIIVSNKILSEKIINVIENSNEECFVMFLCELSKFECYDKDKIIKKCEMYMKENNVRLLVLVLDSTARFYLNDPEQNMEMRSLLQKIKTYKNQCSEITRIEINACLSRIIKKKRNENIVNDFLSYTIKKGFDPDCEFGTLISKEMAIIFFMKPWIFEDLYFIVEMIVYYKIEDEMKKMYNDAIFICLLEEIKDKMYFYVRIYANLVKYNDSECEKFVKRILKLKKNTIKVLIVFLKEIENKKKFVNELEVIVEMQGNSEEKIEFRNFTNTN